jgi:hypothetical protein
MTDPDQKVPNMDADMPAVSSEVASSAADATEEVDGSNPVPVVPWQNVSVADLGNLGFELPIAACDFADCHDLADLYQREAFPDPGADPADSPSLRVCSLLGATLNMYFKPEERHEPFGPLIAWADGRRSPITSDFKHQLDVLAIVAEQAHHPALKARTADICWLLDRKRWTLGLAAVVGYVDVVRAVDQGRLKYRFESDFGVLGRDTCDHLRRALFIGRALGWKRPEVLAARELVTELRTRAAAANLMLPLLWFCELDFQFGVTEDRAELAQAVEAVMAAQPVQEDSHLMVDMWRFASRAYFAARREEDAYRCRHEAAENLVRQAYRAQPSSSLMAATLLSSAIAQLSGSPTHKARWLELRHQLVDIQGRVPDELSSFSHPIDLTELVNATEKRFGKASLLNKLFLFACLEQSPDPEVLERKAAETLQAHPLSGLFGASHLDREGKVIHRTLASGLRGADDGPIRAQIAQAEAVRRHIMVAGEIQVARQMISVAHHLPEDSLYSLLELSPAVPPAVVRTFAYGFMRFFQGDYTGATYVLIPMLEAMLRHVLKSAGHDVTTFDDATETQQNRTISSLYDHMRTELDGVFGPALTTDIENVFLTKPGPHLRHALSHGLLHDASPAGSDAIYGCWLIFRLCLLPLVRHRHDLGVPADWLEEPVSEDLGSPFTE